MTAQPKRVFAGARARALRARLALSQSAMAARVGLSVSYLSQLESDDRLAGYPYLASTKADLLRRLGRRAEAASAYRAALALTENAQERAFLDARLAELS